MPTTPATSAAQQLHSSGACSKPNMPGWTPSASASVSSPMPRPCSGWGLIAPGMGRGPGPWMCATPQ
eukprot:1744895-Lingulodinium_polyedra.AAC.1